MISKNIEDYIRAIYLLERKNGPVRSKDLVDYLNVRKSSVSEMVAKLRMSEMILHNHYSTIALTKKGHDLAEKLTFKHRVIEAFLTKMLKRNKQEVHGEAHLLEHAFSDQSVNAIYNILGKPKTGVHGEEIPNIRHFQ